MRAAFWIVPLLIGLQLLVFSDLPTTKAAGSTLSFSPTQGEYFVDSTFDVAFVVNTGDQPINTVEANIKFPPDKLQVVSLSKSFIEIWVAPPSFSNTKGTIELIGGLPTPGITTSAGVVITATFRVKSAGQATLQYESSSKVLANDGNGTNILTSRSNGVYNLKLPPPEGPAVSSSSHPDQNRWYNSSAISLQWGKPEGVTEFSYLLDHNPASVPDETAETSETTLSLKADSDGVWYFHIRGKGTAWGGTTHFIVRVDTKGPASFKPVVDPSKFANNNRGVASFRTTDATSGVDHYEVKVINLKDPDDSSTVFTEESSPYLIPELDRGKYSIVIRAFDEAGNYTDGSADFHVTIPVVALFFDRTWVLVGLILGLLLVLLTLFLLFRHLHHDKKIQSLYGDLGKIRRQINQRKTEVETLAATEQSLEEKLKSGPEPPASNPSP